MKNWSEIKGFSNYKINENGLVISNKSGKWKKMKNDTYKTHHRISIVDDNYKVCRFLIHRLVYSSFNNMSIYDLNELIINHKDGCPSNNNILNLEIVKHADNLIHGNILKGKNAKNTHISYEKRNNYERWRGTININGVRYRKSFRSKEEAIKYINEIKIKNNIDYKYSI